MTIIVLIDSSLKITEAIRRYGISKGNEDVVVVKIGSSELLPAEELEKMKEVIDGTLVPFTELGDVTDWSTIKKVCVFSNRPIIIYRFHLLKYYKLNGEAAIKGSKEHEIIDNIVVSSVAMKSVMS